MKAFSHFREFLSTSIFLTVTNIWPYHRFKCLGLSELDSLLASFFLSVIFDHIPAYSIAKGSISKSPYGFSPFPDFSS